MLARISSRGFGGEPGDFSTKWLVKAVKACPSPQVRMRSIAAQPTMATAQPSIAALEGKLAINVVGTVMTAAMRCWDCIIVAGCCRYSAYFTAVDPRFIPAKTHILPHSILLEFY